MTVTHTDAVKRSESNAPYKEYSGCQDLGETIGGGIRNLTAEVGQRRRSNHLYWECGKQYDPHPKKPAWHFWKMRNNKPRMNTDFHTRIKTKSVYEIRVHPWQSSSLARLNKYLQQD